MVGQVVEEILNRGKAEWLAQGRAEGEAKGLARALRRLLERRFGPLPLAVRTRIAGATASDLDVGFAAALDAESLSVVFPDLGLD